VTGATDGPRGGIEDAGDDVGKYTSVAVSAGVIHVSYYDATNSTLKYARRENDKWSTHTVDKDGQMVGRFTSITISNGVPVIAYFVGNNNKGESQLRIATAKSATPGAEADWTVAFAATKPLPKCKGACDDSKNEVCTESNKVFSCKVPTADPDKCKPTACDKDTQVCVAGKCLTKVDDSTPPLPNGTGLFPSIATLQGGGVVVVYYVKDSGDLAIATENAGNFQVKTLKTAGDVGQFPSVAVDASGLIHISYINNDTADVHYLQLDAQYNIKVDEVVDNGNINGEDRQLADTSIAVAAGGDVRIVYQDASVQAIKMAVRRGPKQWEAKNLASGDDSPYKGAFGFFADQIIDNNTSHISNFKVNLRDDKNPSGIDIRTWP
jgi:predicted NUDIX family NTP pyrophosphohydrolase